MSKNKLLKAKIISETAKIPWIELQIFFAQRKVIKVSRNLDLVDISLSIAQNNTKLIANYITRKYIRYVEDYDAKKWLQQKKLLWTSIVKPWILVQEEQS